MPPILLLLYFLPISLGQGGFFPPGCGRKDFSEELEAHSKVLGGNEMEKPFPWIVRVGPINNPCTGSLISKKHVLTAGHCFATRGPHCYKLLGNTPGDVKVCYGTLDSKEQCEPDSEYSVTKIHLLDRYVAQGCNELLDIAVLELDREVADGIPVCLPTLPLLYSTYWNEVKLYVTGYGNNNDFKDPSEWRTNTRLRFALAGARIPCPSSREQQKICTNYDDKSSAICEGDSGGPLTEMKDGRHVIVGINQLSLGAYCSFTRLVLEGRFPYQAHVEVAQHMREIMEIVNSPY